MMDFFLQELKLLTPILNLLTVKKIYNNPSKNKYENCCQC